MLVLNFQVVDPKRAIPREQMSPLLPNHPPPFLEVEPSPGCKLSLSGFWVFFLFLSLCNDIIEIFIDLLTAVSVFF